MFGYVPGTGPDHRVRIHGVVEAHWGQSVFITDGVQGASVLSSKVTSLQPGDTGIGIPLEKQKTIFEAFSQANSDTTRKFGGTGLGLTISTRILELMGGRIWVESEPGAGSCFHFTLEAAIANNTAETKAVPSVSLAGVTALIVDDNATNRRILKQIAELEGMKVATAPSAAAGLRELQAAAQRGVLSNCCCSIATCPTRTGSLWWNRSARRKRLRAPRF